MSPLVHLVIWRASRKYPDVSLYLQEQWLKKYFVKNNWKLYYISRNRPFNNIPCRIFKSNFNSVTSWCYHKHISHCCFDAICHQEGSFYVNNVEYGLEPLAFDSPERRKRSLPGFGRRGKLYSVFKRKQDKPVKDDFQQGKHVLYRRECMHVNRSCLSYRVVMSYQEKLCISITVIASRR